MLCDEGIVIVFWRLQITKDIKFHHQYLQFNANGIFLSLYLDSNILTILEVFYENLGLHFKFPSPLAHPL
jgi:hypothetical protein